MTGLLFLLFVISVVGLALLGVTAVAVVRALQNGDTPWAVAIGVGWLVGFGWLVAVVYLVNGGSGHRGGLVGSAGSAELAPPGGRPPAAWHPDPTERYDLRYWDGTTWTEHVSRAGTQATDPL